MYPVASTVPHADAMSLLGTIEAYGDDWLHASATIDADNLFLADNSVPSWVGIEYMAQAVAAWAGTQALGRGDPVRVGFLVGTRKYTVSGPCFAVGSTIRIQVKSLLMAENGLGAFECQLTSTDPQGRVIDASATLNVFQPEDPHDILKDSQ